MPANIFLATGIVLALAASALADDLFEERVAPVLIQRCIECHNRQKASGGLDLTTAAAARRGGDSGPALNLDRPAESYLLERVELGEMPPEIRGERQRLPEQEIDALRQWLRQGASWPDRRELDLFERTTDLRAGRDWWSLQPVVKPAIPESFVASEPRHPIDAFVLTRLEEAGMTPAPRAEKRVLIRRLYYDLLGLPPTQEQIEQFVADDAPDAWEQLIDSLLAMPQYGERWGRYWLDLARYADTSGYERDQEKPFAWKYRDWVIQAYNEDMPYSEFIVQQLAGDEIEPPTKASVIATGFLRLGAWNDEPNDPLDYQYERLEDMVHATSTAFLALTVKCARCHTHKFDPILQDDYYRIAAVFWPGPVAARDSKLLGGPSAEELGLDDVLGWTDLTTTPRPLRVLKDGDRASPLHEVTPASLSTISSLERSFVAPAGARTTTRRLQLARWIADPRNPLTARVLVNRLWQHHFGKAIVRTPNNFGFLADPPTHPKLLDWLAAEFLARGESLKAIHKLILTSQTWQQASLHPNAAEYADRDPSNRWWWRAERRRLDAEALRDSMLVASDELDLTMGGPSFKATVSPAALEGLSRKSAAWQASPLEEQSRRSVYMYLKRGLLPPMMTAFDLCDATQPVGARNLTNVPTQALVLLNNQFVHDRSQTLANRIADATEDDAARIRQVWTAVLRREPTDSELRLAAQHLATQALNLQGGENLRAGPHERDVQTEVLALASLCHVLFNSNEFVYID